jgi:adenylate cyclase
VLASEAVLERAGEEERERWRLDGEVVLRGRTEPTRLAVLAGAPAATSAS